MESQEKAMCKIFKNPEWEELSLAGGIPHFGYYQRYRLPDNSVNPKFREDKISGLILDVKDKRERGIAFFYNALQAEIESGVSICVVPGHNASTINDSGIAVLAHRLASEDRVDKVDYIIRTKSIDKLAKGGLRDFSVQLDSLGVNPSMEISGDVVLLVDDVTTTGNSLQACKEILIKHGAKRVAMFALGASI